MKKEFSLKFKNLIAQIIYFPRIILRKLIFDFQYEISLFSMQNIFRQKKILKNTLHENEFNLLRKFLIKKKKINLIKLINKIKKKKITCIKIYSFLVNLNKYQSAAYFHKILCSKICKNCFFYYQICTLNFKNIKNFLNYSKSYKFRFIFNFLLYRSEKNFINTILCINEKYATKKKNNFNLNKNFHDFISNKKIIIIGPIHKKIKVKKSKKTLVVRFKNNNYLKLKKDILPNIIYLNGTASAENYHNRNYIAEKKTLSWIVFINETLFKLYNYEKKFIQTRYADNTTAVLFNSFTELNLLQKVLLDLFLYKPYNINLFNFDLKITLNSEIGYGIYNTAKKQKKIKLTFNHNQIVMFDFIKFFYESGKINLDNRLSDIINQGKNKYLVKIEKHRNKNL